MPTHGCKYAHLLAKQTIKKKKKRCEEINPSTKRHFSNFIANFTATNPTLDREHTHHQFLVITRAAYWTIHYPHIGKLVLYWFYSGIKLTYRCFPPHYMVIIPLTHTYCSHNPTTERYISVRGAQPAARTPVHTHEFPPISRRTPTEFRQSQLLL